jgi:limonene-1,2-epoxide hydrolase
VTATRTSTSGPVGSAATEEEARAWVEAFTEGWRAPAGADAFAAHFEPLVDPEVRLVQPMLPTVNGLAEWREGFVRPTFTMLPGLRGEVHRWASSGDAVYIEFTLIAAIGRRSVRWHVVDRFILHDGRPVERVSYFDPAPLVRAVATSPSAWPRFLRGQAQLLRYRLRRRRSR